MILTLAAAAARLSLSVLTSREQLDGLIVKLQSLSADMRTREPRTK